MKTLGELQIEFANKCLAFSEEICDLLGVYPQHKTKASTDLAHELSITIDEFVKKHTK